MPLPNSSWFGVIRSHFVLCTFLGILLLDLSDDAIPRLLAPAGAPPLMELATGSLVAGFWVAAITWMLHWLWFRRVRRRYFGSGKDLRNERRGTLVGFACGALSPFYLIEPLLLQLLALVFLFLILVFARSFLRRVAVILRPGNHPRPEDIAQLGFAYGTLAASFTVLNVAIAYLYRAPDGTTAAFRGFEDMLDPLIDSFYLTVVVMTTLGFGDITPVTGGAKLAISMQVVVSYLLFALMVGTITRGILPRDAVEDSAQDDSDESR